MLTNKKPARLLNILLVLLLIMACISCNPKPAEVVRTYEYDEGTVIIRDSQGDELERYTKQTSLTTHYEYGWSNSTIVSGAWGETYVDIGDGKEILIEEMTVFDMTGNPIGQFLSSPYGPTLGQYSLIVEKSYNRISWTPEFFYSDLPSKVYRYDGEDLIEVESLPQSDLGSELGKVTDFNVIFSDDFTAIQAVLPRTSLSEPVMKDDLEIYEIGFTLVSLEGEDNLLPYITGDLPDAGGVSKRKTIVYSRLPDEFEEIFKQLIR